MDSVDESIPSTSATPSSTASSPHTPLRGLPVAAAAARAISTLNSATPRTCRSDGQDTAQSKLRSDIARHMKDEIVYCEREAFEKHYLPFTPSEETVASCMESLKRKSGGNPKILAPILSAGKKWRDFPVLPPEKKEREDPVFERLTDIINTLSSQKCKGKDGLARKLSHYHYSSCPNKKLDSSVVFGTDNRIDACMTTYRGEPGKMPLTSIAVPLEFKLDGRKKLEVVKNRRQIVSAVNQIMNEDARRMFMYGITIEGPWVTMWYFSRSHSAVSQTFDFLEDPETFVRIFVSLLFATDEELGFDPHVFLDERDGSYIYEFPAQTGNSYFRTTKLISGIRSLCITGRAARIWKVRPVKSRMSTRSIGADLVLKDVWLDENSRTEKEIQDKIFADIETFADSDWRNDPKCQQLGDKCITRLTELFHEYAYRSLFLAIGQAYLGKTSKNIAEGVKSLLGLLEWPQAAFSAEPASSSIYPLANPAPKMLAVPREYIPKTQSRFVFQEVCTALHDLPTVGDVMTVLRQAMDALLLMFCGGWVHRDISSGNILAFETAPGTWSVKLADLEYAKSFPHERGSSDPKTGTPFFMAYEIQQQASLRDMITRASHNRRAMKLAPSNSVPGVAAIVHNFQHDVESIWWIVLWIITAQVNHPPSIEYSQRIFQNTLEVVLARQKAFAYGLTSESIPESFLTKIILPALQAFVKPLEDFRADLMFLYTQRSNHKDLATYAQVYPFVHEAFLDLEKERDTWGSVPLLRYSRRSAEMQDGQAPQSLPGRVKRKRLSQQLDASCEPSESRGSKKSRTASASTEPRISSPLVPAGTKSRPTGQMSQPSSSRLQTSRTGSTSRSLRRKK